ncbi:MAG TPA: hypothetical protein VH853_07860 [Polyangia bacterium]|nr:hypothetical protein [Polyangia bacterium]
MKALPGRPCAFSAAFLISAVFLISAGLVSLAAGPAKASGEVLVSLDYQTDPALAECPTAADFRREIVRQLGRDPFRAGAPRRLVVRLYPKGPRMGGQVEWRDAHDEWEGERTFSSRNESCAQVARAMALATAIQIQLLARVDVAGPASPAAESKPPRPAAGDVEPAAAGPVPAIAAVASSSAPAPSAPAQKEPRIAVDVGVGLIRDFGDSPAFVLPRVAIWWGRPSAIDVRLAVSGLGPGAEVARPQGAAQIDRLVMTLELVRRFRSGRALQPLLAIGAGWQDVRARGTSSMPSLDHEGQVFSGLLSASGGLTFALAGQLFALVEAEALLFRPSVSVQVGSSEAAHLDGAALFVHGGLLARF